MSKNFAYLANKPNELLDLVDEDDQIIGEVIRKEANTNPKLFHREVGVLIFDKNQKLLLQKRSKYKTVNPSTWSITAGHILKGQDPEQTAHTEMQEELGFDTNLDFAVKRLNQYPWETHFMYYFLSPYDNQEIIVESAEVEKVRFFSQQELKDLIKSGEKINYTHVPVFEMFWSGDFDKVLKQLK